MSEIKIGTKVVVELVVDTIEENADGFKYRLKSPKDKLYGNYITVTKDEIIKEV